MRLALAVTVVGCTACGRIAFDVADGDAAGATKPAKLVLADSFEGPLGPWAADCQSTSSFEGPVTDRAHGGAQSVRFHYGIAQTSSTYCAIQPELGSLGYNAGLDHLYVRAWVSIAVPKTGATTDIGRPLFQIRKNIANGVGRASFHFGAQGQGNGTTSSLGGELLVQNEDGTDHQQCFFYDAQTPFCNFPGPTLAQTNDLRASYDEWHCIETAIRCNSRYDGNDGRWMAWIDGQLKIDIDRADGCGEWLQDGLGAYQALRLGDGADGAGSTIDELRYWDDYELYDTSGTDLSGVPRMAGCR